jgi:hypothetical protein
MHPSGETRTGVMRSIYRAGRINSAMPRQAGADVM